MKSLEFFLWMLSREGWSRTGLALKIALGPNLAGQSWASMRGRGTEAEKVLLLD